MYADHILWTTVSSRGYRRCSEAEATIDIYAVNDQLKHASRLVNSRWESKMRVFFRMIHPRKALAGPNSIYGDVVASYKYDRTLDLTRGGPAPETQDWDVPTAKNWWSSGRRA